MSLYLPFSLLSLSLSETLCLSFSVLYLSTFLSEILLLSPSSPLSLSISSLLCLSSLISLSCLFFSLSLSISLPSYLSLLAGPQNGFSDLAGWMTVHRDDDQNDSTKVPVHTVKSLNAQETADHRSLVITACKGSPLAPIETCRCNAERTKIAHRRSLAIFTADEGIAGNSAARTIFTLFLSRRNRGSLAMFFAEEIERS